MPPDCCCNHITARDLPLSNWYCIWTVVCTFMFIIQWCNEHELWLSLIKSSCTVYQYHKFLWWLYSSWFRKTLEIKGTIQEENLRDLEKEQACCIFQGLPASQELYTSGHNNFWALAPKTGFPGLFDNSIMQSRKRYKGTVEESIS